MESPGVTAAHLLRGGSYSMGSQVVTWLGVGGGKWTAEYVYDRERDMETD